MPRRTAIRAVLGLGLGFTLAGPSGSPAEPLRDITLPACSSRDADFGAGLPALSANCTAPAENGRRDRLEVRTRAARGKATFGDFTVTDAYLYNGSFVPEVWALDPGDTIDVTLENAMTGDFGRLTNLHTHGMIVSPKNAGGTDLSKPLGDNIYVLINNGDAPPHKHQMAQTESESGSRNHIPIEQIDRVAGYEIYVPEDHPSGVFWYHPHPHGISEDQVGGGLGGLITVGLPADYVRLPGGAPQIEQRLLMLKDIQLTRAAGEPDWRVGGGIDWAICSNSAGKVDRRIPGGCLNGETAAWLYTVNGQLYPTIEVDEGAPQLWRIANTSANVSYRLELAEIAADGSKRVMPFQVVSVDGVAVGQTGRDGEMQRDSLLMMPSARVEIYVAYDDGTGRRVPEGGAKAVFRQAGFLTGAKPGEGNDLPAIDLAEVVFTPHDSDAGAPAPHFVAVDGDGWPREGTPESPAADSAQCPRLQPDESRLVVFDVKSYALDKKPGIDFPVPPSCEAVRYDRYWFNIIGTGVAKVGDESSLAGIMDAYTAAIGMKYASTAGEKRVASLGKCFDERLDTCVPYPSVETWWIANPSDEAHNFHIHQTRFQILKVVGAESDFTPNPNVFHDNYPVLAGQAVKVRIPFDRPQQVGSFVYHCHILDHEDEGMMAAIEVRDVGR